MPSSLVVEENIRIMCHQWLPEVGTMSRIEVDQITKTRLEVDRYVITARKEDISWQNLNFLKRK